jgi:hypothetical protein
MNALSLIQNDPQDRAEQMNRIREKNMSSIAFCSIRAIPAATSMVSSLRAFRVLTHKFMTSAMTSQEKTCQKCERHLGGSKELTCKFGPDYGLKDVHKSIFALCKTNMPSCASFPWYLRTSIAPRSPQNGVPEE